MDVKQAQTLGDLETELKERRTALDRLEKAESFARNEATSARNALNDTQKKIDVALHQLRKDADRDTHWGADRRRSEQAAERAP